MRDRLAALALIIAWPVAAGASASLADSELVLPKALGPDFTRVGATRLFAAADLYGAINGGAELFLEFGFVRLTEQKVKGPHGEIEVDLYRMKDEVAALGIYLLKCGKETPSPALAARHSVSKYQLLFQRGRVFALLTPVVPSEEGKADLVALARAQVALIPSSVMASVFGALPVAGRVAGSERLIRGPVALQALYTLGDGDPLQLEGIRTAKGAEYEDPVHGRHMRLTVPCGTVAEAAATLAHLRKNLDPYLEVRVDTKTRLVFEDSEHLFGEAKLEGRNLILRLRLAKRP